MDYIVTFFIAVTISFIVSIPIGAVNMAVFQTVLHHNLKAGFSIGIGAVLAEAIYCGIPLFGLSYLLENSKTQSIMLGVFIPVMIYLGIINIVNRNKWSKDEEKGRMGARRRSNFAYAAYGFFLCFSNPMTFLLWIGAIKTLKTPTVVPLTSITFPPVLDQAPDIVQLLFFLVGVPTGTLLLYGVFALLAAKTRKHISMVWKSRVNALIGVIFLLLSVYLSTVFAKEMGWI